MRLIRELPQIQSHLYLLLNLVVLGALEVPVILGFPEDLADLAQHLHR